VEGISPPTKDLCEKIYATDERDSDKLREWLVKNIKGLGYKEASHFLRNIGYENVAIIDYHILDLLSREGAIPSLKKLGKREYIMVENVLKKIAERTELSLGELDLYLWYLETGQILK
jgi:N-glycosylase/DNA lyase